MSDSISTRIGIACFPRPVTPVWIFLTRADTFDPLVTCMNKVAGSVGKPGIWPGERKRHHVYTPKQVCTEGTPVWEPGELLDRLCVIPCLPPLSHRPSVVVCRGAHHSYPPNVIQRIRFRSKASLYSWSAARHHISMLNTSPTFQYLPRGQNLPVFTAWASGIHIYPTVLCFHHPYFLLAIFVQKSQPRA